MSVTTSGVTRSVGASVRDSSVASVRAVSVTTSGVETLPLGRSESQS
ncbi:MAG: hypothetical protein U0326_18985 [Polyangiales bacterium]